MRYALRMRRPLISGSYLDADPPGSPNALHSGWISFRRKDGNRGFLTRNRHNTSCIQSSALFFFWSFCWNSRDTIYNETIFTIHNRSWYHCRIIERSTAPFVITRARAECRRRDANISDVRAILSRTSRFRVFLEKLCNDARCFMPGRTCLRMYFTPRIG